MFSRSSNIGSGGGFGRRHHSQSTSIAATADLSPISGLLPAFPVSLEREKFLEAAYKASLTGGVFFDTKFYVFSRRRNSGVVDTPRAVYANSAILRRSSQYFIGRKSHEISSQ